MIQITKYLDPAPGNTDDGGNGGNGGGGNPPATPTAEQVQAQEQAELSSFLEKGEAALTPEEKAKFEVLKGKYDIEEVDENGAPLSKEAKEAKAKLEKQLDEIRKKPEANRTLAEVKLLEDNTPKSKNIYEEVDELTGTVVEVDYKDVNPLSPQGIQLREEAIRDQAIASYDQDLKERYPVAYQLFLHQQAGGKVEDFFKTQTEDFSTITLTKTDVATQENVLRKALSLKGNLPEQIDAIVTYAKDKGKLFEQSKLELEALQKRQADLEQERTVKAEKNKQLERQIVNTFFANLDKTLEKGLQGIVIPKAERKAFTDFVTGRISVENGKLIYATILDPNNLTEELAANYFKFKKADLSKLVTSKAKDLNVTNFQKKVQYKFTPKTSSGANKNYVPLGEL